MPVDAVQCPRLAQNPRDGGSVPAIVRHKALILIVTAVAAMISLPLAVGVERHVAGVDLAIPDSQSERADRLLAEGFGAGGPDLLLVATAPRTVDEPAAAAAGRELTRRLAARSDVRWTTSYWQQTPSPRLRSFDGRRALLLVRLAGGAERQQRHTADVVAAVGDRQGTLRLAVTGPAQVISEANRQGMADLRRGELIAAPIVLGCLVLAFGSVTAALLPLLIAGLAIIATFPILRLLSSLTDVSVYALNTVTILGIGLAIDYSLLVVARFRQELAAGVAVPDAVSATVRTAGQTVAVSGVTVMLSMAAALTFPTYALRSMAYAGIPVVAFTVLAAVITLPALLALLGHRIDRFAVRSGRRRARPSGGTPRGQGGDLWSRLALAVMRRPVIIALVTAGLLAGLGLPFLGVQFGVADDRVLPAKAPAHVTAQVVRSQFPESVTAASVVLPDAGARTPPGLDGYARDLSRLPTVTRVDFAAGTYRSGSRISGARSQTAGFQTPSGTWLSVASSAEPVSAAGSDLVRRIRAVPAPGSALVGGDAARFADVTEAVAGRVPWAAAIMVAASLLLIAAFTRSLLLPVKAVVLNVLSLTATFGALVFIFQDGHLRGLVGDFTPTGTLDIMIVMVILCIAYGLSMDYHLFLLSSIQERHRASGDNTDAVAHGLQQTGRLVTTAAALMVVVLAAFTTSGLTAVKMFGVGLGLAVLVDATLVRCLLVPALMRLAGRANWWFPGRSLHHLPGSHLDHPREDVCRSTPSKIVRGARREYR
ncbi:MMPL family transporter [Spirillospora sp. CA-294931]|uniref:MMPL family transporter n=1 Tax=Spirillospora sp. CA-294931 TaxID=3240042 RepID=UPI003D90CADA